MVDYPLLPHSYLRASYRTPTFDRQLLRATSTSFNLPGGSIVTDQTRGLFILQHSLLFSSTAQGLCLQGVGESCIISASGSFPFKLGGFFFKFGYLLPVYSSNTFEFASNHSLSLTHPVISLLEKFGFKRFVYSSYIFFFRREFGVLMKVKKQKRHRRSVKFYTTCFGFREPFKILCDGTFIHNLVVNKIKSAGDALSDILHASTRLFTTRCVIAELKSLGDTYSESLQEAHNLSIARCDHEKRKSAVACIEEVIGEDNHEHFFLATQDTSLREKFREIPGVPVIFGLRNSLFLEQPSAFQRQYARSVEEKRLHVTEWEYKMLQNKKKTEYTGQIETDSPEAHEGSLDDIVMPKAVAETKARRRMVGLMDKPQFKRKKAKAPNPLSCKKKQNLGDRSRAPTQVSKDGENANGKRKRKRKRSHKGHAEADT
ncbi:hypothetical protein NE237_021048 [Protea cynaroides]|uniref:UTP23 sensor motif region domain-containing protein n=1 Tax=Protea cynaroides TaxID=273540 RepID=A0A9Q0H7T1_9MAGN|nr:hypothetical protein NE237_021048 [Protea cynaroides]